MCTSPARPWLSMIYWGLHMNGKRITAVMVLLDPNQGQPRSWWQRCCNVLHVFPHPKLGWFVRVVRPSHCDSHPTSFPTRWGAGWEPLSKIRWKTSLNEWGAVVNWSFPVSPPQLTIIFCDRWGLCRPCPPLFGPLHRGSPQHRKWVSSPWWFQWDKWGQVVHL